MIATPSQLLTLQDFLALPEGETALELIAGQAIPKMSPKRFHSRIQRALLKILENWQWGIQHGELGLEWAVTLKRHGVDWVPVPDLLYVRSDRLPDTDAIENEPCPVPPDLTIEIVSPGQSFAVMVEKATDYLAAGVQRIWIVDPQAKSIVVFWPDRPPQTYRGNQILKDNLLPELEMSLEQVFAVLP